MSKTPSHSQPPPIPEELRWPGDPGTGSAEDFGDSDFMFYGARRAPAPLQPWWRRGLNWLRALRLW